MPVLEPSMSQTVGRDPDQVGPAEPPAEKQGMERDDNSLPPALRLL